MFLQWASWFMMISSFRLLNDLKMSRGNSVTPHFPLIRKIILATSILFDCYYYNCWYNSPLLLRFLQFFATVIRKIQIYVKLFEKKSWLLFMFIIIIGFNGTCADYQACFIFTLWHFNNCFYILFVEFQRIYVDYWNQTWQATLSQSVKTTKTWT